MHLNVPFVIEKCVMYHMVKSDKHQVNRAKDSLKNHGMLKKSDKLLKHPF
jgi:hypothetical protein